MPHFYDESIPAEIRNLSDAEAIEQFVAGGPLPAAAIAGLTREQLNSVPIPNTWSIQQIVIHLLDTDLIAVVRMKRALAEDHPHVDVYDENAFARNLSYDKVSAPAAAELFRLHRIFTADVLRHAPPNALNRVFVHPDLGHVHVAKLLRIYIHHVHHHLAFIHKKRKLIVGR